MAPTIQASLIPMIHMDLATHATEARDAYREQIPPHRHRPYEERPTHPGSQDRSLSPVVFSSQMTFENPDQGIR